MSLLRGVLATDTYVCSTLLSSKGTVSSNWISVSEESGNSSGGSPSGTVMWACAVVQNMHHMITLSRQPSIAPLGWKQSGVG